MKKEAAIWERVDALKPWTDNPRKNKGAIEHVAESIKRFGFASPIIARAEDKTIIAGHTRYEAAKKLGLDSVPVRYLDLDPADSRLLALADNKIGEIAEWDEEKLEKVMQELLEEGLSLDGLGWNDDELSKIVDELKQEEIEEDEVPEADEEGEPDSKLGEVYELGEHRLICGDSTLSETWDKLMQGERADMVFTDPPYGIAFNAMRKDYGGIKNDKTAEEAENVIISFLRLHEIKTGYICCDWRSLPSILKSLDAVSIKYKACIVWDKKRGVQNLDKYYKQHEMIIYWGEYGGHKTLRGDVWQIPRDFKPDHPTPKPTELIRYAIEDSIQKNNIVIDAFGGSGSTLIAAAQTKRRARLVELDPKYCDVIRKRWTQYAKDNNLEVGTGGLE